MLYYGLNILRNLGVEMNNISFSEDSVKSAFIKDIESVSSSDQPFYKPFDYLTTEESARKMIEQDIEQLDSRNEKYTHLLEEFISDYQARKETNRKFKSRFFYVFIGAFVLIVLATILYIIITIVNMRYINIAVVSGLVAACSTLITAIIAIPQIIAKYLFSIEEDKFMADIIRSMLTQDDKIRSTLNHH